MSIDIAKLFKNAMKLVPEITVRCRYQNYSFSAWNSTREKGYTTSEYGGLNKHVERDIRVLKTSMPNPPPTEGDFIDVYNPDGTFETMVIQSMRDDEHGATTKIYLRDVRQ